MTFRGGFMKRLAGCGLVLLMAWSPEITLAGQQPASQEDQAAAANTLAVRPQSPVAGPSNAVPMPAQSGPELPDSPGAVIHQPIEVAQQQNASPELPSSRPQAPTTQPVGTAAAEAPTANGIAASEPAGTAMAPAKQRQVRSFLIKVGAVLGAGAALGTVMALSQATSSKPPGSH
jgi:hypothetical protein